jgi:hypothetical protein
MPATYDLGDSVGLKFTVKAKDIVTGVETLTNATVTLVVTKPDGSTTSPSVTNASTGIYTAAVAPDQAGEWLYRWAATGAATTAEDGAFLVEPNLAGTLYATVAELRDSVGDSVNQRLDPNKLEQRLRAASRAIDNWCFGASSQNRFWLDPAVAARTYNPDDLLCARVDDIGSTSGLLVKTDADSDGVFETTWTVNVDFILEPVNAASNGGAYRFNQLRAVGSKTFPYAWTGRPTLQVTARHGWSQIPDPVREATLLKAIRLNRRPDAPFGNELGGVDIGPIRITREDSDVMGLLSPYKIPAGFA